AALLSVATNSQPDLYDVLRNDERGMVRAVKRIIPEDAELVLFIDQFEEVFTLVSNEDERVHFLQTILNAVEDERSRIKIVITLRADFYDRPLLYGDFGKLIREHTELVLPLDETELEEAIVAPARQARITLERGLVDAIITDVYQQPGALPLLQYALTELFERRSGRLMTLDAYKEIGGTTGALARRAEELYQSFTDAEKDATRQMFLRLVALGEGTEDTRRRVFQSQLLSLKQNAKAMPKVIEQFGKFRLLTFDNDPQTRSSTVEVAHEALIRQWDRVGEWLDENREALRLHRRLSSASDEWNQARRDPSFLARGMRLQQFETLESDDSLIVLNETETLFVSMSVEAREERAQEEAERIQREEALEERARRRLQLFASVMAVAAIIAIGAALFAVSSQMQAQRQAHIAQENAATATVAQGDAIVARDEAATSAAIAQSNEAESRALALSANARNADNSGDPQLALALALQAENVIREAGNLDNIPAEIVRTLSDIAYAPGPSARYNSHDGSVTSVAFSSDSRFLASASVDGTIIVTDTQTDDTTMSVSIADGWFYDVAMHPGNTSVAGAASDGNVYIWAYPSGELLFTLEDNDEVHTVDYSPDGRLLASGGNTHDLIIWNVATGEMIRTLEGHTGVILNVVFSADGSRIVSSSGDRTLSGQDPVEEQDRTVRVWDVESGEELVRITPNSGFVRALDFSPTGDTVAYGVWDNTNSGTVRVHDAETGEERIRFNAHTTSISTIAYSVDGTQIASIGWDRTLRFWDLVQEIEVDSFVGFADRVLAIDYSANGESLAIGVGNVGDNIYTGDDRANDTSVWIWDVNNRQQVDNFTGHNDWAWTVDVSPDSTLAASGGGPLRLPDTEADDFDPDAFRDATTVYVWDTETLEIVSRLQAHTNTVDSVRFHPAGDNRVLTSAWDSQIILWDALSAEQLMTYEGHTGRVYMVRFVGDGSQFVSVGTNGEAFLWDTETGEQVRTFAHEDFSVNAVDVNEDGSLIATTTSSGDNKVYLWERATGEQVRTFEGHAASVNEVRFHPSGDFLVSSAWDSSLRVWDINTGTEVRDFSGHNGHTFGIDFTEDGAIMLTTSQDTTVRMWDWATGEELQRFDLHTDWIQEVVFLADDQLAISAGQDETLRIWRINRTAESLEAFALENRYIRSFTCSELDVYRLDAGECAQD
ncbi:MAG: WD40 repeat domain-containing protein, partial [Chloroflexota bacterium]